MAQTVHGVVAVGVLAAQRLHEGAAGQGGGENLHDGVEAVALIAAGGLAQAADGKQGALAGPHILQDLAGVGHGVAVVGDQQAGGGRLAAALIELDLAVLDDGGGAVKVEGELLIGGDGEGEGVGTHHGLHAEGGGHGGAGVGAADADHASLLRHGSPVARDAVVGGVADRAAGHAVLLGLLDEHLHHPIAGHHAHAVVGVHHHGGGGVLQNLDLRFGQQGAVDDAVDVNGLKAVAAVALDAPAVRLQQNVGTDFCVLLGHAVGLEHVDHKRVHQVPCYIRSCLHKLFSFHSFWGVAHKKRAQRYPVFLGVVTLKSHNSVSEGSISQLCEKCNIKFSYF